MQDNNINVLIQKIKDHKEQILIVAVVLLVVVAALLAPRIQKSMRQSAEEKATITDSSAMPEGCKPGFNFSETTGKPCPVPEDVALDQTAPANEAGYEAALAAYKGKVLAFGADCSVTPKTVSVAAGTRIMAANNSTEMQTITLGDRTVALRPYHYFTQSMKTAGEVNATCNGAAAATVTVK